VTIQYQTSLLYKKSFYNEKDDLRIVSTLLKIGNKGDNKIKSSIKVFFDEQSIRISINSPYNAVILRLINNFI